MKLSPKRLFAGILALVLLFSAGCNGAPGKSDVAMGRYIETELALPADFAMITGLRAAPDGTLELLAYPEPPDGTGTIYLHLYRSADNGVTWAEETPAWLDFFNAEDSDFGAESAAWAPDGTLWFYAQRFKGGEFAESFARLDGDTVTVLDWEVPTASTGEGARGFRVAENGDLILDCWSEFLQVDSATGKIKQVYTTEGGLNDGSAIMGNILALSEQSRITRYDLTTGKKVSDTPCHSISGDEYSNMDFYRIMDFSKDGDLYFADPTGLYRSTDENNTLERLSDGSLSSLSTPSLKLQQFLALEGQYLAVSWSNEEWSLYSYTYDPTVPTLPDSELTVWSLRSDPLVAQGVSEFQKKNPGVHVSYTTGMPEDGSITRDDAIRAINTQLVAGKGPDVLVIDGLPYASYVEKGVLADISAQLGALDAAGSLLSNIASAYKQKDGKVYAVPAQFQVPMLHGSDAAMSAIRDLETMADYLESVKADYRFPFLFTKAKNLLRALYPSCVAGLIDADGRMNQTALSDFLAQMKRITDLRTEVDESDEHNDWADSIDFDFGPLGWTAGNNALNLGNLTHFEGLYAAWTASDKAGDGSADTLFGAKTFLPITGLGVSAQSGQQELAWQLIETVLSESVQSKEVGSGMPVSAAAFDLSTTDHKSYNNGTYSTYGTTFFDADGATNYVNMVVLYPPEEYRKEMAELLKGLDTPIFYDESVLQIIIDGTWDYWSDKAELDATVEGIMQKLALYEAE